MTGSGPASAAAAVLLAVALVVLPARGPAAGRLRSLTIGNGPVRPAAAAGATDTSGATPTAADVPAVASGRAPRILGAALGLAVALGLAGPAGPVLAVALGVVAGGAVLVGLPRLDPSRRIHRDPWTEAGAWDQLAACLRAGLPLPVAARAVVPSLAPDAAAALTTVADLVALGADPADAWVPALEVPATARLARAARRSARTGAAVADVVAAVAVETRAEVAEAVTARAERASVLVTGPLGLCFLPAFLALGIVPVVIGLAGPLLEQQP